MQGRRSNGNQIPPWNMYLPHNKEHLCGICILLVSKHILYIVTKKLDEPLQLHEMMNYVFLQLIPLEESRCKEKITKRN